MNVRKAVHSEIEVTGFKFCSMFLPPFLFDFNSYLQFLQGNEKILSPQHPRKNDHQAPAGRLVLNFLLPMNKNILK
nr:MAG TPA: hypothetical protein [Caudoviricetes sp.]